MSSVTPDRRTVIRTAAWAVPAVTLATTAPAFATTPPRCLTPANPVVWQTLTVTRYSRVRTLVTSPITKRTDGVSKIDYTIVVPRYVLAGATVPAQPLSYTSTLTTAATKEAYDAGGRKIKSGWLDTRYSYEGGLTPVTTPIRMSLFPENVNIPSSGRLVTNFTGNMPSLVASTVPGTYQLSFVNAPDYNEDNAASWVGSQTVEAQVIFTVTATAKVHSQFPATVPAQDWVATGTPQDLNFGSYEVLPACTN